MSHTGAFLRRYWLRRRTAAAARLGAGAGPAPPAHTVAVPAGRSPAETLASETISALTGGLIEASVSVPLLGACESLIGIGLMTGLFLRPILGLLVLHLFGTLTPLILFPGQMFVSVPFVLTLEAQYIVKNFVLISSALVIAAATRNTRASVVRA